MMKRRTGQHTLMGIVLAGLFWGAGPSLTTAGFRASSALAQEQPRPTTTITSRLTENNATLDDGSYYNAHSFEGRAGESVRIDLVTTEFDAYVILVDPAGNFIAQNDDVGEGRNARLVVTLPSDGTYQVLANSHGAGEVGQYQLRIAPATANFSQDERLRQAVALNEQAIENQNAGRYEEAEVLFQQALEIFRAQLNENHPNVASMLNNLANLYKDQGRYEEAERFHQQAIGIRRTQLGNNHFDVANSLNNLASLYTSQSRYDEAESLLQQALDIYRAQFGETHPEVANSLNNLAAVYEEQGRYSEAESLYLQALDIRRMQLGETHPDVAGSLNNLAIVYEEQGRYSDAESLHLQALDIRRTQLGETHPDVAGGLNNLANLYETQGRYGEAERLHLQSVEIFKERLGNNHPLVATSLNNLANLYETQGRYGEAERLHLQSIEVSKERLGNDHPLVAASLNNLANLYENQGRYGEADPLYTQAIKIFREQLGETHPNVADSLGNLGALRRVQGRYEEAESLVQQALEIYRTLFGEDHPAVARGLNNLAVLYIAQGRYSEAESFHLQALEIERVQLGETHSDVATSLNNLAFVYNNQGRYGEAEPLYRQALEIRRTQLGETHPDVAGSLNNLGFVYNEQGRYGKAEPLYRQALEIRRAQLGETHPEVANSFINLTSLHWAQGQLQPTLSYLQQGLSTQEAVLSQNLIAGSDTDKRKYLATVEGGTDFAISLNLNFLSTSDKATELALSTILQRKGRILDQFTNLRNQLGDAPEALALFDELNAVGSQLSALTYNPPEELTSDAYRQLITDLKQRYQTLEDQLSRRSSEFADLATSPNLDQIQSDLPNGTALVEFIRYRPVDPVAPQSDRFGEAHYAAYVLTADGSIEGLDLGPAAAIDGAVANLTRSLASADTPRFQVKEEAQALDALVMAPVRDVLGATTTVFVSPDGALNLIPFEALADEQGNYLVETYQFRYLTSGRDLMRLDDAVASSNPAVLVGNPTYGRPGETVAQAYDRGIDFENLIFPALSGTQVEVDTIGDLLSNESIYTNINATEAILKQQAQPSILHIATHGFFQPSDEAVNPLLQSGLILAGAAAAGQSGPDQDGILTALEVTGINLRGTQLVVLSACETGLGELSAGEGVYGLRRALVLAGSQSQVISLWKVSDQATQALMVAYYERLLAGMPRDETLRETQLAFLEDEEYSHPYYWAAFIGSGNWRSLSL